MIFLVQSKLFLEQKRPCDWVVILGFTITRVGECFVPTIIALGIYNTHVTFSHFTISLRNHKLGSINWGLIFSWLKILGQVNIPLTLAMTMRLTLWDLASVSNGDEITPMNTYASVSNADGDDSGGSSFAPWWVSISCVCDFLQFWKGWQEI